MQRYIPGVAYLVQCRSRSIGRRTRRGYEGRDKTRRTEFHGQREQTAVQLDCHRGNQALYYHLASFGRHRTRNPRGRRDRTGSRPWTGDSRWTTGARNAAGRFNFGLGTSEVWGMGESCPRVKRASFLDSMNIALHSFLMI